MNTYTPYDDAQSAIDASKFEQPRVFTILKRSLTDRLLCGTYGAVSAQEAVDMCFNKDNSRPLVWHEGAPEVGDMYDDQPLRERLLLEWIAAGRTIERDGDSYVARGVEPSTKIPALNAMERSKAPAMAEPYRPPLPGPEKAKDRWEGYSTSKGGAYIPPVPAPAASSNAKPYPFGQCDLLSKLEPAVLRGVLS